MIEKTTDIFYRLVVGLFLCSASISVIAAVIAPTITPESRTFKSEKEIVDPDTGYSALISIKSKVTLGVLLGEPVLSCVATWKLIEVSMDSEEVKGTSLAVARNTARVRFSEIPKDIQKDIRLYDVKLDGRSKVGDYFLCDPGVFHQAYSNIPSFTFPSSPSWGAFYIPVVERTSQTFLKEDAAKLQFLADLDEYKSYWPDILEQSNTIHQASINLWALKHWLSTMRLQANKEEAENNEAVFYQAVSSELGGEIGDKAFDSFMTGSFVQQKIVKQKAKLGKVLNGRKDARGLNIQAMKSNVSNDTCVENESLEAVSRDWDSGKKMYSLMQKCANAVSNVMVELVRTDECFVANDTTRKYCNGYRHYFRDTNTGRKLTDAIYSRATGFSEQGFAVVGLITEQKHTSPHLFTGDAVYKNSPQIGYKEKHIIIDRKFKPVKELPYYVFSDWSDGKLVFIEYAPSKGYQKRSGVFNQKLEVIIPPGEFVSIYGFNYGLSGATGLGKYGGEVEVIIDDKGNKLTDHLFNKSINVTAYSFNKLRHSIVSDNYGYFVLDENGESFLESPHERYDRLEFLEPKSLYVACDHLKRYVDRCSAFNSEGREVHTKDIKGNSMHNGVGEAMKVYKEELKGRNL